METSYNNSLHAGRVQETTCYPNIELVSYLISFNSYIIYFVHVYSPGLHSINYCYTTAPYPFIYDSAFPSLYEPGQPINNLFSAFQCCQQTSGNLATDLVSAAFRRDDTLCYLGILWELIIARKKPHYTEEW